MEDLWFLRKLDYNSRFKKSINLLYVYFEYSYKYFTQSYLPYFLKLIKKKSLFQQLAIKIIKRNGKETIPKI